MIAQPPARLDRTAALRRGTPFRRILLVNPPMANIGAEFMMEDVPLRLEYLAAFVLEYAAFLWLPLLFAGLTGKASAVMRTWSWIATAALVPHVLYVIAIGGDHF